MDISSHTIEELKKEVATLKNDKETLKMSLESKERQLRGAINIIHKAKSLAHHFSMWDRLKYGTDGQKIDAEKLYPEVTETANLFIDLSVISLIAMGCE